MTSSESHPTSAALFARATQVMPGGVNSPVRAFKGVAEPGAEMVPPYIVRGEGPYMWDADGHQYLDMVGSWGPLIHGHAHPDVLARITETAASGTSFGANSIPEVTLAERICEWVPSCEMVRMTSSGTEATMAAIRLARAATGRPLIVKFEGCFHGHSDPLLQSAGSGVATLDLPDALGIPGAVSELTKQVPFNDVAALESLFGEHGPKIAGVIIEPVAANMGVVPPVDGYLQRLRELCTEAGSVLIFDEVMTGFRLHQGGYQAICGVTPDLTTMGKVIGGGMPVGAFGGRRDLMAQIAPSGGVYHAGTLSGNPVAMAAGLATLDKLGADDFAAYRRLEQLAAAAHRRLEESFAARGIAVQIQRIGSMLTVFFADGPVRNFADAKASGIATFNRYFRAMLAEGIYLPPSNYEAWFFNTAMGDEQIDELLAAHERALAAIA